MRAELAGAAAFVIAAIVGVRWLEARAPHAETPAAPEAASPVAATAQPSSAYRAGWGEEVRIAAARDHQYYVTAAVNDAPASFLVDTGASYVALRDADARRAGVYAAWTDFNQPVRTANGETKAALVALDRVEIDGIRIENVKAFILPDDQLSVNLLGMSFLSKLESVEARGGELVLKG
jgi:aspartyl protease family protein